MRSSVMSGSRSTSQPGTPWFQQTTKPHRLISLEAQFSEKEYVRTYLGKRFLCNRLSSPTLPPARGGRGQGGNVGKGGGVCVSLPQTSNNGHIGGVSAP